MLLTLGWRAPPMHKFVLFLISLYLSVLPSPSVLADNWPQFRGPQACGVDSSKPAPVRWDLAKSENILWQTAIPGLAHSSPILWNERIYLTTALQRKKAELKVGLYGNPVSLADEGLQQWRLLAIDRKSGKILWNTLAYEKVPEIKRHPKATHCNPTPATDGEHIAAIFGSEGLFCFDMKGNLKWHKDLGPMDSGWYVDPTAQWGFASSPVIHDGKVVVLCDVQTNSFVALFDLRTGKELWRTPREDVPTWGTPTVAKANDRVQVLVNGWHHTGGYDFLTGKELWRLKGGGDIPVPTPILGDGVAYFTSGHGSGGRPIRAIRLNATTDITSSHSAGTNDGVVWVQPRLGNYMQTPILTGENLYACQDTGLLTCFDPQSGAVRYSERLGTGNEGFTSSPISDGRNLFIASEVGNVYVVAATANFTVIATNKLNESCMATPLISNGTLVYRTQEHLVAIGR